MPASITTSTSYLPNTLLLLVHLHLLEYPYSNRPEYDHNVFNPRTRGLRDRAKTMEDVAYFLVGRLEGKGLKTILATYPCNQPSESLAFRTSLTKYLENLRHHCIYPTSSRSAASSTTISKTKAPSEASENSDYAWWWKDVIVRKSLLEECAGDKFERLLLSLSTHTLMRSSQALGQDMMSGLLRSQPAIYSASLARYQLNRHAWAKSASLLTNSQADLKMLRDRVNTESTTKFSKYNELPTERLQALANATLQDLLQRQWTGEDGKAALDFIVELAALKLSSTSLIRSGHVAVHPAAMAPVTPSPLPIAAAHHPAHLKRLRRPIFASAAKGSTITDGAPPLPVRSHAEVITAERLVSQKWTHQHIKDALSRLQKKGSEMREKFNFHMTSQFDRESAPSLSFWTHSAAPMTSVDCTPKVGKEFMASLGFQDEFEALDQDNANEDALERRIEEIRQALPTYPGLPDLSVPRLPPRDVKLAASSKKLVETLIPKRSQSAAPTSVQIPKTVTIGNLPVATPGLPVPPIMSPGKSSRSSRRKSVRFSVAQRRSGRASTFRVFSGDVNSEVDKLVDETHDFPTDDEDDEDGYASPYKTPRGKGKQKINRIWTAGTPTSSKRRAATPRASSDITLFVDGEPKQRLPSLALSVSAGSFGRTELDEFDSDGEEGGARDVDATPKPRKKALPRRSSAESLPDKDGYYDDENGEDKAEATDRGVFDEDPPSMTLKEILLSAADTSYFDLLEVEADDVDEGLLTADASFVWE
ncbi:hypothetical protein BDN70DRAFT_619803 [Pholiota conissans]|uniref:HAUS augmin-like complex subunit 6 N-terminal domain-containing protein n=1 Tax=Pholiota conissans TaxID=109636 RepID=A0A9P6D269_9AGAR|nr:hypothetical protein BDN70DRAFT_619803 [Pholiota conissans]